ncbi:hypothetical protein [Streptomyces sp. HUAS TT20]|uniref:hypothetical protein n=1 Tax=Streptomyces sp. HUAS TT20 TaxID=3447509 RepID=UPI0021D9CDF6|nr:hypothetical protein [Streptomyces sp. HUAS 15-9]UXY32341.1 hypothetical protein N8I87_41515 [Streptomyces sp. HUAS 15-9]
MSEYRYIFIRPGFPRDQLIRDAAATCGAEIRPVDSEFVDYTANLGYAAVEVEFTHEYEEDHDSLFAVRDFNSNLERQEATARRIFKNLAALDRYELLLVRGLQERLASSGPTPQ